MDFEQQDWNRLPNAQIRALLTDYVQLLHDLFADRVAGVYLYNSIALGAFDDQQSDIDFVTLFHRPLQQPEVERLQNMHQQLESQHPDAKRMDGMYILLEHAGQTNDKMQPYPYCSVGQFQANGYYDINSVTWWTLKHHGLTLTGIPAAQLDYEVPWESILATMTYNINGYWTKRSQIIVDEVDDYTISDGVLTVCRILYTLAERDITSKVNAVRYALDHLDPQWRPLLQEALRIRQGSEGTSLYRSQKEKTQATQQFLQAMIRLCQERYLT